MAIKNEGAARGTMRARDEEKNDGTDISIVIKLRIRVEITGNSSFERKRQKAFIYRLSGVFSVVRPAGAYSNG